jgi:outer membrane murein-binding lipoprotein Lpp
MKKVDSKALASAALSAFLVTGCENFATKDELAQVQSELAQASLELQEADQNLQQVQSELDAAELKIADLEKPSTSTASATHFREVVFEFDNLDPVDPANKNDPRKKFMRALEDMAGNIASALENLPSDEKVPGFTGEFKREGVSTDKQVKYVLRNRYEGFVSLSERKAVEAAIKYRAKQAGIAIPLRLDPGGTDLLVLHNASNEYNSVAGTGAAKTRIIPPTLTCEVTIHVELQSLTKPGAVGYVAQSKDGESYVLNEHKGELIVLEGFPGKVVNDKCIPVKKGISSEAYLMAVLENPKVAEYHKVEYVPEAGAGEYEVIPIPGAFTTGMPACPPPDWPIPKEFEAMLAEPCDKDVY